MAQQFRIKPGKDPSIKDIYGQGTNEKINDLGILRETKNRDSNGFSISAFKADINLRGNIRTNRGHLFFSPPRVLQTGTSESTRRIATRCEAAAIPSVWFTSDQVSRLGYGPIQKTPGQPIFDPYTITILADRDGDSHRYFTFWMNHIMGFDRRDNSNFSFYEQSYRKDYITDLHFKVFDELADEILEYTLIDAWPQMIQEQPMNWNEQDQFVRITATFLYTDWTLNSQNDLDEGRFA